MILFQHWISYFETYKALRASKAQSWTHISHRTLVCLSTSVLIMPTKNSAEVFTTQYKAQLHRCILVSENIPLLMKEEILTKKKKCDAKQWDKLIINQ